jgi:endonuclease/exonuclease/phosphatase family metal-dependent hydrolase
MKSTSRIVKCLTVLALCALPSLAHAQAAELPTEVALPGHVDLAKSTTLRLRVRLTKPVPSNLPTIATNKAWESGEVVDYTTNNSFGLGRSSGKAAGFAISVLPDGAWTWNAGDGSRRIDHRPESADQGIADGEWHEVGFAIDRGMGVAHLYHDGRRVAMHDLSGVGDLSTDMNAVRFGEFDGLEVADLQVDPRVVLPEEMAASYTERFGALPRPAPAANWDGRPLKVLAWNIWHGGRRKGRDEGVQRVVEVIEESGADIVLMQETYGSGPRISGRLGFDYFLRSSNLSIMSRFPIHNAHRLYQGFRFGGATIELRPGEHVEVYSLWINHLPSVSSALKEGATGEELAVADSKTRGAEIDAALRALHQHLGEGPAIPVLIGGDFNSGSHLDWTAEAAHLPNHMGRVAPWPVSLSMERAGFIDTFRTRHPDPIQEPGLTWSPEFRDSHQDRIDYVYASGGDWRVLESKVLDTHPRGWPSDHAAVLSTVELVVPAPSLKVISYNTYYVFSEGTEVEAGSKWIAEQAPDVVALQELTNISDARLAELAAGWDHRHTALLKTSGFSVGLTSNSPIELLDSIREGMHHGALHVRIDGIHYFAVHLSPFRWSVRTTEAEILLSKIKPLIDRGEKVIVLGDFNAMSPADRELTDSLPNRLTKARTSDAKHDHVENLRDGAFDYSVMKRFFDAGLVDTTLPFLERSGATRWTCTTGIWSEAKTDPPSDGSRIDFILASPNLARSSIDSHIPRAGILNRTSDHYPVCVEFKRADVRSSNK